MTPWGDALAKRLVREGRLPKDALWSLAPARKPKPARLPESAPFDPVRFVLYGEPRTKNGGKVVGILRPKRIRVIPPKPYRDWLRLIALQSAPILGRLQRTCPGAFPIARPISVKSIVYRGTNRAADLDRHLIAVGDCLQRLGFLVNDRLIRSWDGSRLMVDQNTPRVECEIACFPDEEEDGTPIKP